MTGKKILNAVAMFCLMFVVMCSFVIISNPSITQAATKAKINKKAVTLEAGKTVKLKVTGTTVTKWSTSNKKIAKVSAAGKVTAVKAGTATIKAKCANGKTYKCVVTVTRKASAVAINEANFPDENFRNYLSISYDLDKNGKLSVKEINAITDLFHGWDYNYYGSDEYYECKKYVEDIQSLEGIEYFPALKMFYGGEMYSLKSLDLSKNPKLETVWLVSTPLEELNVSNTNVSYVHCDFLDAEAKNIKVTANNCPELFVLDIMSAKEASVNINNCPKLDSLTVDALQESSVYVKNCPLLKEENMNLRNVKIVK